METPSKETHWVTDGDRYGDPSGKLLGSRKGLVHLRALIQEALDKGSVKTGADVDFGFIEIEIRDTHPRDESQPTSPKQTAMKYGCATIIAVALVLMCIGFYVVAQKLF